MQTCAIVTQKGGAAKTTVAVNLLAAARQKGVAAIVIDIDPQRTATDWGKRRSNNPIIRETDAAVVPCEYANLDTVLGSLRRNRYDLAIIDTPGMDGPASLSAMRECDFAVVPLAPTSADVHATFPTMDRLASLKKRFGFVLTSCVSGSRRADDLAAILRKHHPVADAKLQRLVAYQDAIEAGLGVTESRQNVAASHQVEDLWRWLTQQLPLHLEQR